jgi:hypothetical protein
MLEKAKNIDPKYTRSAPALQDYLVAADAALLDNQ